MKFERILIFVVQYFVKKTETLSPYIDIPLTVPYNYVRDPEYEDFEPNFTEGAMKQDRLNASGIQIFESLSDICQQMKLEEEQEN